VPCSLPDETDRETPERSRYGGAPGFAVARICSVRAWFAAESAVFLRSLMPPPGSSRCPSAAAFGSPPELPGALRTFRQRRPATRPNCRGPYAPSGSGDQLPARTVGSCILLLPATTARPNRRKPHSPCGGCDRLPNRSMASDTQMPMPSMAASTARAQPASGFGTAGSTEAASSPRTPTAA